MKPSNFITSHLCNLCLNHLLLFSLYTNETLQYEFCSRLCYRPAFEEEFKAFTARKIYETRLLSGLTKMIVFRYQAHPLRSFRLRSVQRQSYRLNRPFEQRELHRARCFETHLRLKFQAPLYLNLSPPTLQ